tara:strand:- start:1049 stop:2314 length:1266 start_codon:yes stop_codon:yes gene_type:complete
MPVSRNFAQYPQVNKGFLSYGTQPIVNNNYTYEDIVLPFKEAQFINKLIQNGQSYNPFLQDNGQVYYPTSHQFNLIKLDVDTLSYDEEDKPLEILLQSSNVKEENSFSTVTQTIIPSNTRFSRTYPVTNEYFRVIFNNNNSSNITCNASVKLSKFTQFSPPIQLTDEIDRYTMANVDRQVNSYMDDVALRKQINVNIVNRSGYFLESQTTDKGLICPVFIEQPPLIVPEIYSYLRAVSDNNNDFMTLKIGGKSFNENVYGESESTLALNGTANTAVTTIAYNNIVFAETNLASFGNISIFRDGTNDLVSYIPAGHRVQATSQFYVNKLSRAVLKEVNVQGGMRGWAGRITIYSLKEFVLTVIHEFYLGNANIDVVLKWTPDLLIDNDTLVYAVEEGFGGGGVGQLSVEFKAIKYLVEPAFS